MVDPIVSIADQAFSAAVGFLASIFLGSVGGAETLGIYAATYVIVVVVGAIQNAWTLQAMSVVGPRMADEERPGYFGFLFWSDRIIMSVVAAFGAVVVVSVAWAMGAPALILAAIGGAFVYSAAVTLQSLIRRQLYLEGRPILALRQSLICLLLIVAGLAILYARGHPSVAQVYVVLAASSAIVSLGQLPRWRGSYRWPAVDRARSYASEHWRFGKWILLTVPFVIGTYQGYYFLTGVLLSARDTGLLKAVDTLVVPYEQVVIGLTLLLTPRVSEKLRDLDVPLQKQQLRRILLAYAALGLMYAFFMFTFGGTLLRLAFGPELSAGPRLLSIMALLPLVQAFVHSANIGVMALGRPEYSFASRVVATAGTATIGLFLMLTFGLIGAAWGLVASVALLATGLWISLFRYWGARASGVAP